MSTPDVTVVVPVYNTMPYLTRCLASLAEQTIGLDRLQVVAVDDGSTDRGGRELDRFAQRYPGVFTVIHQANSGGPAGPCNRALDVATGRYVFFLGADDYLGSQALQRLVAAADEYGSDVVLGKVVGVHSRFIHQDVFARNEIDISLTDAPLARSLANTKLFRRELLDKHRIRYIENLPLGSDLPFTLEACYRARRVSVLADYDFYYAVRRFSATNITYLSRPIERLRFTEFVMKFTADLIEPGKVRDAVLARRFDHEVAKLLDDGLLRLDRATQQQIHEGIGRLAAEHLTDGIRDELDAQTRIRTAVARHGTVDDLLAVVHQDAAVGVPVTVVESDRRYARYPGFRKGRLPDACFDVTTARDWPAKLDATALTWENDVLTISAHTPAPDLPALTVSAEDIVAETAVTAQNAEGTTVQIRLTAAELLAGTAATGRRRTLTAQVGSGGAATVRAPRLSHPLPLVRRRGARLFVITPVPEESGRLMISVVPVTPRRVLARLRSRLHRRRNS